MGSDRGYLSLYAQLQRRPADLCSLRQQRRLPTKKDLGENSKTGKLLSLTMAADRLCFFLNANYPRCGRLVGEGEAA